MNNKKHLFDNPKNVKLVIRILYVSCFVLFAMDLVIHRHTVHPWESFTGFYAIHPFTGKRIPIYLANFVLMGYGTGAIFGCPAHDQRDFDFATKYDLPILPVVIPTDVEPKDFDLKGEAYTGPGRLANSAFLDGLTVEEAKSAVINRLEQDGVARETLQDFVDRSPSLA